MNMEGQTIKIDNEDYFIKDYKITKEELNNIKTYFDNTNIVEDDNVLFCYLKGDIIKKSEYEFSDDSLVETIKTKVDVDITKIALNHNILEIIKDNLVFISFNEKDSLPIFELNCDVDSFYGTIKHKSFINDLTNIFGKELVDSIDIEYSSYQQEVYIYLLNTSYQEKFEKFLYQTYQKNNPTVIINKLKKYNVIDEDTSHIFYMYNLLYNEDVDGFNKMYEYMNDINGLKKVEKGADLIKEYFGYTE